MSSISPTPSTVTSALKRHAEALVERAQRLATYAEGLSEMSEEQFMAHLGNEYAGAGFMRQMQEEVLKASEVRPSDLFQFNHSLGEVFAKAQRADAQKES